MEKSLFQFSNPHLESIYLEVNDASKDVDDIPIEIGMESFVHKEEPTAVVKLRIKIGELADDDTVLSALYFDGCIVSEFSWEEEIPDIENKLRINGGTVLLSYIRPILANLTMQAGIRPLHLPFINFNK